MEAALAIALRLLTVAPQMLAGGQAAMDSWRAMTNRVRAMNDEQRPPTQDERDSMDRELAHWEARLHAPE